MEDQLKKIVWIFVVQTFLLFYLELLEKFCLFFKKSRLFLMKSSKVIPIYTILLLKKLNIIKVVLGYKNERVKPFRALCKPHAS